MNNDLISRQAAIDAIRHIEEIYVNNLPTMIDKASAQTELMLLPSAQPEQRWIPCSERLPENDDWQIVTILDESGDTSYRYSDFGWYLDKAECWIIDAEQRVDIVAWMPLPEPYSKRRTDEGTKI